MILLGTVIDAGGGEVRVLVDRDLDRYPDVGATVYLNEFGNIDARQILTTLRALIEAELNRG